MKNTWCGNKNATPRADAEQKIAISFKSRSATALVMSMGEKATHFETTGK